MFANVLETTEEAWQMKNESKNLRVQRAGEHWEVNQQTKQSDSRGHHCKSDEKRLGSNHEAVRRGITQVM